MFGRVVVGRQLIFKKGSASSAKARQVLTASRCCNLHGNLPAGTIRSMSLLRKNLGPLVILFCLLLALFVAIVLLAPPEKSLGNTIRLVYAHVAFTRAGILGFYAVGILGILILISGNRLLEAWTRVTTWVALGSFIVGGIISIFAQRASWGGISLAEPSNRTSLSIVAVAAIALVAGSWAAHERLSGLLYALLAGYVAWILPRTPLILHPQNAGGSSPSVWIRYTFPVLTVIALFMGICCVIYLGRKQGL